MSAVQHVEFFNPHHFEQYYYRYTPAGILADYVDFFWETKFESLWQQYPKGFSDVLFPNIGYTYLVNLGTPFTMQLDDERFPVKQDSFLPRHKTLECFHQKDNHIFGIKFKISPVLFEKKVDFSEYRGYIFPLSYLVDESMTRSIKQAANFNERVEQVSNHYETVIMNNKENLQAIKIVRSVIEDTRKHLLFNKTIEAHAAAYCINPRTLHRYFESTTSLSGKKALQILRIRMAVAQLATDPQHFNLQSFGYYDKSHFIKHLKQFLDKKNLEHLKPHITLLQALHA